MFKIFLIIINIILVCSLGYVGFDFFYRLTSTETEKTETVTVRPVPPTPPHKEKRLQRSDYAPISRRNLFTTQAKEPMVEKQIDIENLKQTDLDLKLWGTVAGNSAKAYAVIEDKKKRKQNLYRPGDAIQNATIKMIVREKVVLTVDGKDEILEMEKITKGGRATQPRRQQKSRRPARTQTITLRKSLIDETAKDIDKLSKEVKMKPHMENGQIDGMILTGIRPRSFFRRMGLRNGDIITSANGERITSPDAALKLLESFAASPSNSIEIKRRGRLRTINYKVE